MKSSQELIIYHDLLDVLDRWKVARETRLNDVEIDENLRCANDLRQILENNGFVVHWELWKRKED